MHLHETMTLMLTQNVVMYAHQHVTSTKVEAAMPNS